MNKGNFSSRVNTLFEAGNWQEARRILKTQLRKEPDNHWLLTRISTTYYEEKNYKKALAFAERAIVKEPNCPLARWDYAGVLDMLGEEQKAIKVWKSIVNQSTDELAFNKCGEGLAHAKALQLDSLFRIGNTYYWMQEYDKAKSYIEKHLQRRYPGNRSIYSSREIRAQLKEIAGNRTRSA